MPDNGNGQAKLTPITTTLKGAHEYTGLGIWRLRKAIRDREISSVKPFGVRLLFIEELDRLVNRPTQDRQL